MVENVAVGVKGAGEMAFGNNRIEFAETMRIFYLSSVPTIRDAKPLISRTGSAKGRCWTEHRPISVFGRLPFDSLFSAWPLGRARNHRIARDHRHLPD